MPRVCSISVVNAMRERTMPSSPRQPSIATIARMVIAMIISTSVKPEEDFCGTLLTHIRHHLRQVDDTPFGVAGIEHRDFDAAKIGIRRAHHVLFAAQLQLPLRAIEGAIA